VSTFDRVTRVLFFPLLAMQDDIYGDEFKIASSSGSSKRPVKQQKLEAAPSSPLVEVEKAKKPGVLYQNKDPQCCVEMEVDVHVSEAAIRESVAPAEVSFVSFETDEVSGLSRGIAYVCFVEAEDAQKVLAASSKMAKPMSASKFERLMDDLNLKRERGETKQSREKDRSKEQERGKDRDRDRERERERERDRDRERGRDRRDRGKR
jgi:RNA recognition motif-containing protein